VEGEGGLVEGGEEFGAGEHGVVVGRERYGGGAGAREARGEEAPRRCPERKADDAEAAARHWGDGDHQGERQEGARRRAVGEGDRLGEDACAEGVRRKRWEAATGTDGKVDARRFCF
jgi:hypothetical protein